MTVTSYMELVKFTDDTYQLVTNDTIITSSSDKKEWCALTRKFEKVSQSLKYDSNFFWSINIICVTRFVKTCLYALKQLLRYS